MKCTCVYLLLLLCSTYCYVEKAYDNEPNNREWFIGDKERDGIKLFVPGDVVESPQLQKRTASYAIQSLVMGARSDSKAYNSARYNVDVPKAADNVRRGIPLSKIPSRNMNDQPAVISKATSSSSEIKESVKQSIPSTPSIVSKMTQPSISTEKVNEESTSASSQPLSRYYHLDLDTDTVYVKNLYSDEEINLTEKGVVINAQTTTVYFGVLSTLEYDVTLTLQTTDVRLNYLIMFLDRWGGPISVAIHCHPTHATDILSFFKSHSLPSRLVVTLVTNSGESYPINRLRNTAIEAAPTSHFMVFDMDVWPVATLYQSVITTLLSDTVEGKVFRQDLTAVIVPVYEYTIACRSHETCVKERASHIPHSKATLRNCLSRHRCREFRAGQNLHNYYFPEWLEDDYNRTLTPVKCFVKDKQEPYLIVKKTDTMPRLDNRFMNYGYNKVQWVTHLRFSGYHFYVFGPAFGVDVAHPRGKLQKEFLSKMKTDHVVMNQGLYQKFLSDKIYKNKRKSVVKGCRKDELEICLTCDIDY